MNIREAVAGRFIELCKEKKTNPNKLSLWSGVHPSTLKGILYGRSQNPSIVTIKKLCDGLKISITEFFETETFRNLEQEIK